MSSAFERNTSFCDPILLQTKVGLVLRMFGQPGNAAFHFNWAVHIEVVSIPVSGIDSTVQLKGDAKQ